jgi:hypothetical protein
MSAYSQTSARVEMGFIVGFTVIWIVLWLLPRHLWLPIPPYRWDSGASLGIQTIAYVWAALLLMLPLLLPLMGGHLVVRRRAASCCARLAAFATLALTLVPLAVIAGGTLIRIAYIGNIDSASSPLFYWWPQ